MPINRPLELQCACAQGRDPAGPNGRWICLGVHTGSRGLHLGASGIMIRHYLSVRWCSPAPEDQWCCYQPFLHCCAWHLGRAKQICYLSPMRAAKVQASLRIRAVSPEPSLLAHTNSESRGTFRQKARSLASLNGWACAVKVCHDGMLEDTNSLDGAHLVYRYGFLYPGC